MSLTGRAVQLGRTGAPLAGEKTSLAWNERRRSSYEMPLGRKKAPLTRNEVPSAWGDARLSRNGAPLSHVREPSSASRSEAPGSARPTPESKGRELRRLIPEALSASPHERRGPQAAAAAPRATEDRNSRRVGCRLTASPAR
jgi:hypothetical protein